MICWFCLATVNCNSGGTLGVELKLESVVFRTTARNETDSEDESPENSPEEPKVHLGILVGVPVAACVLLAIFCVWCWKFNEHESKLDMVYEDEDSIWQFR